MKIGIITPYDSSNLGAFLQAYATKSLLEKNGHEVCFIKLRNRKELKKFFLGDKKNIRSYISRYFFNRQKYYIFQNIVRQSFITVNLKEIDTKGLNAIIIGSDEVWNVNKDFYRQKCFYGIGYNVPKKIAYAPSCGTAKLEDYKNYDYIKEGISNLTAVFPRDEQTKNIAENLTGKKYTTALDPTLLIDIKGVKFKRKIKQNYILVYGYSFNIQQVEYIKKFAQEHNCITVSICMKHPWCDKNINCSPLEFSSIINGAKYIITKTFHGTIFSILNKKNFVTFKGSQKITDLLDKLLLSNRLIDEKECGYEKFKRKLEDKINFSESYSIIMQEREKSIKKLLDALE